MFAKPVDAVIFDMDGLLIDSEAIFQEAMQAVARAMSFDMPQTLCHAMVGLPQSECDVLLRQHYGETFRLREFNDRVDGHAHERLARHVPLKPGVVEILDWLGARGLPLAVATSSRSSWVETHLASANLFHRFTAYAARDHVDRGKPHPDIYLEAARRLGVDPANCLAFEDSNVGVRAAAAAGAMPIMVPDVVQPLPEVRAVCVHVARDLHDALALLKTALVRTSPPRA
jgi:HAD superfamily hydrolase (TIGR01509 family)